MWWNPGFTYGNGSLHSFNYLKGWHGYNTLNEFFTQNRTTLKGTVRPDWICMRVEPLNRPCNLYDAVTGMSYMKSSINFQDLWR
jgi:hypothetical protein